MDDDRNVIVMERSQDSGCAHPLKSIWGDPLSPFCDKNVIIHGALGNLPFCPAEGTMGSAPMFWLITDSFLPRLYARSLARLHGRDRRDATFPYPRNHQFCRRTWWKKISAGDKKMAIISSITIILFGCGEWWKVYEKIIIKKKTGFNIAHSFPPPLRYP